MAARLTIAFATALAACGEGGASMPDARQFDATPDPPMCEDLYDEWFDLVEDAKSCSGPGECIVVDETPRCDDSTVWGGCGSAVNGNTFDAERSAELELASSSAECVHWGIADCGVAPVADCVQGRCRVVDEVSCWPLPPALRSGTIEVVHEVVSNDVSSLGIAEMNGLSVRARFNDLTSGGSDPVFGNASLGLGQCNVYVYTDPDDEFDEVDEGAVVIGDLPPCAFDPSLGRYGCHLRAPGTVLTAASADFDPNTSLTTITIPGETFVTDEVAGMHIHIDGFAHPANGGALPIVSVVSEDQVEVFSAAAVQCIAGTTCTEGDLDESLLAPGTYAIEAGAGAIPGGYAWFDGTMPFAVAKADGAQVPGFTTMIAPSGDTLALAGDSAQLHAMPSTADADVVIRCDECGNNGGLIIGWMIEGVTTDADVTGLLPWDMPEPVTSRAAFACRMSLAATSLVIPADAWAAVLGTSPTRIMTRAMRVTADLSSDTSGATNVFAGHGVVGYTDL